MDGLRLAHQAPRQSSDSRKRTRVHPVGASGRERPAHQVQEGPALRKLVHDVPEPGIPRRVPQPERRRLRRRHHPHPVLPDSQERRRAHPLAGAHPLQARRRHHARAPPEVAQRQRDHQLGKPRPQPPRRSEIPEETTLREDPPPYRQGFRPVLRPRACTALHRAAQPPRAERRHPRTRGQRPRQAGEQPQRGEPPAQPSHHRPPPGRAPFHPEPARRKRIDKGPPSHRPMPDVHHPRRRIPAVRLRHTSQHAGHHPSRFHHGQQEQQCPQGPPPPGGASHDNAVRRRPLPDKCRRRTRGNPALRLGTAFRLHSPRHRKPHTHGRPEGSNLTHRTLADHLPRPIGRTNPRPTPSPPSSAAASTP